MEKLKHLWKTNPVLLLVFIAFSFALIMALWNTLKKVFAFLSSSVKGIGSTLTSDEAKAISTTIFDEVNSIATDEDLIVDKIKVLTLSDYYKVQAAFGIVPYSNTFDNFDTLTGVDSNLTEVLNQTLNESDKRKIKEANPKLPIG
ncbi:hypothetical protein [Flagellimonas sp.]|uniref:hypothetical protein n=1 Tax=Flagellimonas sp. TaxID=2058762 RepID=UPI003C7E4E16